MSFSSHNVFDPTIAFEESVLVIDTQMKHLQLVNSWTIFEDFPKTIRATLTLDAFTFFYCYVTDLKRAEEWIHLDSNRILIALIFFLLFKDLCWKMSHVWIWFLVSLGFVQRFNRSLFFVCLPQPFWVFNVTIR